MKLLANSHIFSNFRTILFISIICMLFAWACECSPEDCACIEDECVVTSECSELQAESKVIPDQYVFYINHDTNPFSYPIDTLNGIQGAITRPAKTVDLLEKYNRILDSVGKGPLEPIYCPCDSSLFMITADTSLDVILDTLFAHAETDIDDEHIGKNRLISVESVGILPPSITHPDSGYHDGDPLLVGLIDSGVDFNKERLHPYLWRNPGAFYPEVYGKKIELTCYDEFGYDFGTGYDYSDPSVPIRIKNGDLPVLPQDSLGHGSHIAGIMTLNRQRPNFRIIPAKITSGENTSLFNAMCGMKFAINHGAKIENLSWGYYSENYDSVLYRLVKDAQQEGVLFVTSAGNNGVDNNCCHHWPSNFASHDSLNNVISVAALDESKNRIADRSNYGSCTVSMAVTGSKVKSYWIGPVCKEQSGTSMAAGFVTRKAIDYKLSNPSFTPQEIIELILSGADPFSVSGDKLMNAKKITDDIAGGTICP